MEQNLKKAKELIKTVSEKTKELNLLLVELKKLEVNTSIRETYPLLDGSSQLYMLFRVDLGEAN